VTNYNLAYSLAEVATLLYANNETLYEEFISKFPRLIFDEKEINQPIEVNGEFSGITFEGLIQILEGMQVQS